MNESVSIPAIVRASNPSERRTAFRRDIQGLRAVAVLAVMLFHTCKTWLPSGLAVVSIVSALLFLPADFIYYSLISRVPEFLLGALITVAGVGHNWSVRVSNLVGWTGLALFFLSVTYIDEKHFPGFLSVLPCMAAGLLIASRKGVVSKWLSTNTLVLVGGLSYSLYMDSHPLNERGAYCPPFERTFYL